MGPGRGRSGLNAPVQLTRPPSTVHGPRGTCGPRAPPRQSPCACPLLCPPGEAPTAGARRLLGPDPRACLFSLSLPRPRAVVRRWPLPVPQSQSGWPTTQGTRNATWTSQRTTSMATRPVPWPCTWRSCPTSKALPPPRSADSPRPPPLPPCSCHFRPSSLPEPRIRSRSPGSSLLLIGSGYLGALGGRPWPCLGKMEGRF